MLKVTDIQPIWADSVDIISEHDLDKIIELPLLEACKILYKKNIKTLMSSCNKFNVLGLNKYSNHIDMNAIYEYGNSYAWITLDYDSLSIENKTYLEKMNDIEPNLFIFTAQDFDELYIAPESFQKRCHKFIDTVYYTPRNVILRFPLKNTTTIKEVSQYFTDIANKLMPQPRPEKKTIRERLYDLAKKHEKTLLEMGYEISDDLFYEPRIVDVSTPFLEEYELQYDRNMEKLIFVLELISILNLQKEKMKITEIIFNKAYISFIMNGERYYIGYNLKVNNGHIINLGQKNDGIEALRAQKELLDLYQSFDCFDILYSIKSETEKRLIKIT